MTELFFIYNSKLTKVYNLEAYFTTSITKLEWKVLVVPSTR